MKWPVTFPMDVAAVQALPENTKAPADAVTELATALKAKFAENRKDKFSEASKVVKHHDIFQRTKKSTASGRIGV